MSQQIYDILKDDIITKKIAPGAQLTLQMLSERFGVSSTPVRQALTILVEDGLVNYYSNVGIKVVQLSGQDVTELYQLAAILDSSALELCGNGPRREAADLALAENIAQTQAALHEDDTEKWKSYSDDFHSIFYENCENSRLRNFSGILRRQISLCSCEYSSIEEYREKITEGHTAVYNAFHAGDYEKAAALFKEHILQSEKYALATLNKDTLS